MTRAQEAAIARVCAKECMQRELVEALEAVTNVLDAFGDLPDSKMSPGEWFDHDAEDKVKAARAVLARAKEQQ